MLTLPYGSSIPGCPIAVCPGSENYHVGLSAVDMDAAAGHRYTYFDCFHCPGRMVVFQSPKICFPFVSSAEEQP